MMDSLRVYVVEGCPACKETTDYLTSKNISFTKVNIFESPETIDRYKRGNGAIDIPIICKMDNGREGKCLKGFDEGSVDKLIG